MRTKCVLLALVAMLVAGRVSAEVGEVRVAVGYGLVYLPFVVMEHEALLEKQVKKAGGAPPKVAWIKFSGGDMMNQAILSRNIDIANTGSPAFLTIWAKTRTSLDVRAIAAYNELPLTLVTRSPAVKTIADFTDADRIALPAVKQSTQAILLQMEAEKVFGPGNYGKLDHLTIGRSHADAAISILSGVHEVNSHFAVPPYAARELAKPGFRVVLTERDVLGAPLTGGLSYATGKFREENPLTFKAYLAALTEAIDLIHRDARAAAAMYVKLRGDGESVDTIIGELAVPGMVFSTTPRSIGTIATFMAKIGSIQARPESWKDLFFPEVHSLPGS